MTKDIQEAAKEKVRKLLEEYDVNYIDYRVQDDEYTISLEKKVTVQE
jgi:hypothetical protein